MSAVAPGEERKGGGVLRAAGSGLPGAVLLPFRGRAWREGLYLLLNLPVALVGFVPASAGLVTSAGLMLTFVGLPLMALVLTLLRVLGRAERARARALLRCEVAEPEPPRPAAGRGGVLAWVGAVLRSDVSWRSTAYALLHLPWGVFTCAVVAALWVTGWTMLTYPLWFWTLSVPPEEEVGAFWRGWIERFDGRAGDGGAAAWVTGGAPELLLPALLGLLVLILAAAGCRALAAVDRMLVSSLLGPSAAARRVRQLESDRSVVVDTSAADLRRIERDLHDGAQARLVNLAMGLGLAKEKLADDPQAAARMVDEAHGEIKLALAELRDLARGIHPAILTDRGLGPALSAVASRCTVPVTVEVDLACRPAPAIEGIAYFTASELLQNVSKHSGARAATLDVWRVDDRLMLHVGDDGRGGARPDAGSGLAGLADRLAAVDGLLVVDSPAGGPTGVTAEFPWRDRDASPG